MKLLFTFLAALTVISANAQTISRAELRATNAILITRMDSITSPTGGVSAATATNISRNFATGNTNFTTTTSNALGSSLVTKAGTNAPVIQNAQVNGDTRIGGTDFKLVYDADGNSGIGRSSSAFFLEFFDLDGTTSIGNGAGTTNVGPFYLPAVGGNGLLTSASADGEVGKIVGSNAGDIARWTGSAWAAAGPPFPSTNAGSIWSPTLYDDITRQRSASGGSFTDNYISQEASLWDYSYVSASTRGFGNGATLTDWLTYSRDGSGNNSITLTPLGTGKTTNVGSFYTTKIFVGGSNLFDLIGTGGGTPTDVTGTGTTFVKSNGPSMNNVNLLGTTTIDTLSTSDLIISNAIGVASGGTGLTNLTADKLYSGNGTNPPDPVTIGSGLSLSGTAGGARTLTSSGGSGVSYDIDVTFTIYGNTATPIWTNSLGTNVTLVLWDAVGVRAGPTNSATTKFSQATFHRYASTAIFDSSNTVGNATAFVAGTNGANDVIVSVTGAAGETNMVRFRGFYILLTNGLSTVLGATNALDPSFNPASGLTAAGHETNVIITSLGPPGVKIFWTTNGSTPSTNLPIGTSGPTYGGVTPQTVTNMPEGTLKAIAWTNDAFTLPSATVSASFVNTVASGPSTNTWGTDFSNIGNFDTHADFDGMRGTYITPATNFIIRSLGRYKFSGNSQSHTVAVYTAEGVLIDQKLLNVAAGTDNTFVYTNVNITLYSNNSYYVMASEVSGGDAWKLNVAPDAVTPLLAGFAGSTYDAGSGYQFGTVGRDHGPVNFKFSVEGDYIFGPETFEGTGYSQTSWVEFGNPNEDASNSGFSMGGSQCLNITDGASNRHAFASSSVISVDATVRFASFPTTISKFFYLTDGSGEVCSIEMDSGADAGKLRGYHGSASSSFTTALSINTTYHFQCRWVKGTGANGAFHFSFDAITQGVNTGTVTVDAAGLQFSLPTSVGGASIFWDDITVTR